MALSLSSESHPGVARSSHKNRVLIVDDHALFAEALKKLVESEFDVVGMVMDARSLLQQAQALNPDVILLDLSMPLLSGSEAGRRLHEIRPNARIIVLTAHEDPAVAVETLNTWASGFLLKKIAVAELHTAIRSVLQGKKYVAGCMRREVQDAFERDGFGGAKHQLTPRQREVLALLAEGHSMKQTASILALTARTVAFHKYKIMDGLGLKNNSDLIRLAIKERLMYVS